MSHESALARAEQLQQRAARARFDWDKLPDIFDKLAEEIAELKAELTAPENRERVEDELGDVLFTVVNIARFLNINPETALSRANDKFTKRFMQMEQLAIQQGLIFEQLSLDKMMILWDHAKQTV